MTVLARYYFHIDLEMSEDDASYSEERLKQIIHNYASLLFRQNVYVDVYFQHGSIKYVIYIAGALYIAIGQYGSFRAGVNQIIEDAKYLEKIIISEFHKEGVSDKQIMSHKNLYSTPKRIRYLFTRTDRLNRIWKTLPREQQKEELRKLNNYISSALYDLNNEDFEKLIEALDEKYRPKPGEIPRPNPVALNYREEECELLPNNILPKPLFLPKVND